MTRKEAMVVIMKVVNSGILSTDIEDELNEIVNCICEDNFEKCEVDERCASGYPNYCEGCKFLKD